MTKLQIANELLKNTENIYLKNYLENYIANMNGYISGHISENDFEILDGGIALDLIFNYIEKENFNITGWQLIEIPIYFVHIFHNPLTKQAFELHVLEDGQVIPRYISNGNEKDATIIQEAIERYETDIKTRQVTIHDEVKITANKNSDNETYYDLEFDGVIGSVYGNPTKDVLHAFKSGILSERERIWDESEGVADDKTMRKLLKME